jgi:hypothetical protein
MRNRWSRARVLNLLVASTTVLFWYRIFDIFVNCTSFSNRGMPATDQVHGHS